MKASHRCVNTFRKRNHIIFNEVLMNPWWNCSRLICHAYLYEMELLCSGKIFVPCGFGIRSFHSKFLDNIFWNNLEYREIYTQMHFYYIYVRTETTCLVTVLFPYKFFHDRLDVCVPTAIFKGNACIACLKSVRSYFLMPKFYERLIPYLSFILFRVCVFLLVVALSNSICRYFLTFIVA